MFQEVTLSDTMPVYFESVSAIIHGAVREKLEKASPEMAQKVWTPTEKRSDSRTATFAHKGSKRSELVTFTRAFGERVVKELEVV